MNEINSYLLSKVFGKKVYWSEKPKLSVCKNIVRVHFNQELYLSDFEDINIFELANKVIEWAFSKGYEINTRHDNIDSIDEDIAPSDEILYYSVYVNTEHIGRYDNYVYAVLKGGEYVMKRMEVF